jgi:hypothetical protein
VLKPTPHGPARQIWLLKETSQESMGSIKVLISPIFATHRTNCGVIPTKELFYFMIKTVYSLIPIFMSLQEFA